FAVCAMTPHTSARTLAIAAGLCITTSAFGIAVSTIGTSGSPSVADRPPLRLHLQDPRTRLLLLRFLVAPAVAGAIATGAGIGHPYWGMVAAVSVLTAPSVRHIASRGTLRAVGTVAGLGVTAAILALDPGPAAIVAVIIVAQVAAELFVMRNYGVAAVFITPLALLMGQLVHPVPTGELLAERGLETLIGITVGVTVAWITGRQANRASPQ
ncbi:MAG: FUSC family protein, partial [Aeromicrobium sp.]